MAEVAIRQKKWCEIRRNRTINIFNQLIANDNQRFYSTIESSPKLIPGHLINDPIIEHFS